MDGLRRSTRLPSDLVTNGKRFTQRVCFAVFEPIELHGAASTALPQSYIVGLSFANADGVAVSFANTDGVAISFAKPLWFSNPA